MQYSKTKIELLHEEAQGLIDMVEERPEIKKMRDEFIASLPKVTPLSGRFRRTSAARSTRLSPISMKEIRSTSRRRPRSTAPPSRSRRCPTTASTSASCGQSPPSSTSHPRSSTGSHRASSPTCTGTTLQRSRRSSKSAGRSSTRASTTTSPRIRPQKSTAASRSSPTQCCR